MKAPACAIFPANRLLFTWPPNFPTDHQQLLTRTFPDKVDILQQKLNAGVQVKKYITSFGDRSNDFETVVGYFRAHFNQVHRKNNEKNRVLYSHFTSVVVRCSSSLLPLNNNIFFAIPRAHSGIQDTKTTRSIIANGKR